MKILKSILLAIPLFIGYYFVIAIITSIPLFMFMGAESGGWVFAILLSIVLSPILTVITLVKMNKR